MKQTTKVLLPLGLFMSIVIPIGVKFVFVDTDFFESDNSNVDYIQPYKSKPEDVSSLPKVYMGENGLQVDVSQVPVTVPVKPSYTRPSRYRLR